MNALRSVTVRSLFATTRWKLTFWYVGIILSLTVTLSGLFFLQTNRILRREFVRIEHQIVQESRRNPSPVPPAAKLSVLETNLVETRQKLLNDLVILNVVISLIVGLSSYFLSGKTLQPIKVAMQRQKQFVADAAHELKTPITSLQSSLELAAMSPPTAKKTASLISDLQTDITQLTQLIERLLLLSKIDYFQNQQQHFNQLNCLTLLTETIHQLKPLAQQKKVTLKLTHKPQQPALILGNEDRIRELMTILIENAIVYTALAPKPRNVEVSLNISRSKVSLLISDTGIGIPNQELPKIFDRFYQVDTARTLDSPESVPSTHGAGLGLSIAKQIAELHSAHLKVTSKLNHGTTFIVTFAKA